MRKINIIIGLLAILLLLTTACSNVSGTVSNKTGSETAKTLHGEDRYYRNIFAYIENGAYADAEKLIQKDIIGNTKSESDAERICNNYSEALYKDFNAGLVTKDEISAIQQAAGSTSLGNYICSGNWNDRYKALLSSKNDFDQAKEMIQNSDYAGAVPFLCGVLAIDTNYQDAVKDLYDSAVSLKDSSKVKDLKFSLAAYDFVLNALNEPENNIDLEIDSSKISCDYADTKYKFAQALEMDGQYYYALQQYSQLRFNRTIVYEGDDVLQKNRSSYAELLWMLNQRIYEFPEDCNSNVNYYEISKSKGEVISHGELEWTINDTGAAQVSYAGITNLFLSYSAVAVLLDNGTVSANLSSDFHNEEANQAMESIEKESKLTWVRTNFDGTNKFNKIAFIGLRCDGTVAVYGSCDRYDVQELSGWKNVIELIQWRNGYIGLTSEGKVLQTSSVENDFSGWSDVISLSYGYMYNDTITGRGDDAIFGLTDSGVILHTNSRSSNKQYVDCTGIPTAIAGEFYLNNEGTIHSIVKAIDDQLIKTYGNMTFKRLVANTGIYKGSIAMALTNDGQWIQIHD